MQMTRRVSSRQKELDERTERAKLWLEGATAESPTELAFQLLGLSWAGAKPHSITAFTDAILAAQRSDGGWASLANLESDAWITAVSYLGIGDLAHREGKRSQAEFHYCQALKLSDQLGHRFLCITILYELLRLAVDSAEYGEGARLLRLYRAAKALIHSDSSMSAVRWSRVFFNAEKAVMPEQV